MGPKAAPLAKINQRNRQHTMADTSSYLNNLFGLEGKVAVVIGGTGELCGTMAEGLASAGAEVILVGRSEEKANARLKKIKAAGGKGYFASAEVGNRESLNDLLDSVIEQCQPSDEAPGRQGGKARFREEIEHC